MLTAGDKTNITCLRIQYVIAVCSQYCLSRIIIFYSRFTEQGKLRGAAAVEYSQRCTRRLDEVSTNESQALAALPQILDTEAESDKTWLDMSREEVSKILNIVFS